tara:strand:+ start:35 stop:556 length:522 start_codon:yes stop_codon:yes gene_type:complete
MLTKSTLNNSKEDILYNNILLLSRSKLFYTKFDLIDTFQNRIILIFIHVCFLFIKIKQNKENNKYKHFYQEMFDLIFKKIELNMREIGYGDVTINKNMKFLVKTFYNILLDCENFKEMSQKSKNNFLSEYLKYQNIEKNSTNLPLIQYFEKYESFCFNLKPDSVLEGDLNFKY